MRRVVLRSIVLLGFAFAGSSAWCKDKEINSDSGDKVFAEFADQKITLKDFAQQRPGLVSWFGLGTNVEQVEASLQDIILTELLAKEAESSGLTKTPEVKAQINSMLASAYLKRHMPKDKIVVEDAEIEKFYHKNRDKYASFERVRFSQIFTEDAHQAAQAELELKQGQSFKDVAAKYSRDPISAARGGDMGTLPTMQLLPELREKIKKLKLGKVSEPIQSSLGYHLLRLDEEPKVNYSPLEDVRKEISTELARQQEKKRLDALRQELWKKYDVAIERQTISQVLEETEGKLVNVNKDSLAREKRKPGQPSELQFITETLDLGKIPGEKFKGSVLFTNTSDREIKLQRVGSTCNCIEVSADKMLVKAGEKAHLNFTYDPNMFREEGRKEKLIFFESEDRIEPRKFIRLNLEVTRG